jgi:hypothetical protein
MRNYIVGTILLTIVFYLLLIFIQWDLVPTFDVNFRIYLIMFILFLCSLGFSNGKKN